MLCYRLDCVYPRVSWADDDLIDHYNRLHVMYTDILCYRLNCLYPGRPGKKEETEEDASRSKTTDEIGIEIDRFFLAIY